MIQIISDNQSEWAQWMAEVMERLEEDTPINRMLVVAETEEGNEIIEFMNCSNDDIHYLGSLLQKEAIKHEIAEELGLDFDNWEYMDNDQMIKFYRKEN